LARAPSGARDLPPLSAIFALGSEEPRAGLRLVIPSDKAEATLKIRAGYDKFPYSCR